ncbi:MAG TPA: BamA/TamA family outer membrane protein [Chitinophagaceae bacterium]
MSAGYSSTILKGFKFIIAGYVICLLASCVVVKRYPPNKPFVYKTNINVIGNFSSTEKADLTSKLENQLDDSVNPRTVNRVLSRVMKNPPVYEVANADKSVIFMRALLKSLGYFNDSIAYHSDTIKNKADELRVTLTFDVKPGILVIMDSIWHNIHNPALQSLAMANQKATLLKKGDPFAKAVISAELDRLVELYRNNGYLRISREEFIGLWDTLDVSTLHPSLDPLEQLAILEKLAAQREKPTADIEIRLRPGYDSSKLTKYFVGNVNIFPDYSPDTAGLTRRTVLVDTAMYVIQYRNKFKPKIFPINISLKHGALYSQRRHQRTINRLNSLSTWRLINIKPIPRYGVDTVDFNIELTPSDKYLFNANLEASQNQSAVAGNLFGIGASTGIQNRNLWRAANQSNFNFRYGVELGNKFIQTQQASVGYNIYFPRPVPAFRWIPDRLRDNIRTVLSFNAANTERRELYNLTTINGSWGYEYQRTTPGTNKTLAISLKIPNIEYSYLTERDSLKKLIIDNPALKNIFTDGFVSSIAGGVTFSNGNTKTQHILSFNGEISGLLTGLIHGKFLDSNLYRFIKVSAEYTKLFKLLRTASLVLHGFAGAGYELNSTVNPSKKNNLPFFKQYFAGGPNSMRAWRLRKLGPGSVIKDFAENPERYGDVQLELNAEYRFKLANFAGVRLESVLFTDIGNVWFLKKEAGTPEEVFNVGRLWQDLGIGVGTGLRVDFTFFLIRVDYAFKAKDPSPDPTNAASQNKWFDNFNLLKGQIQIGINYPFKL